METLRQLQEAINWEALRLSLKWEEWQLEGLLEEIGLLIPLGDPLTLHPTIYSRHTGLAAEELLKAHSSVKEAFFKLAPHDRIIKRGDSNFPEGRGLPRFLYARGNLDLLKMKRVTIAGTSSVSNQGRDYTTVSVKALIERKVAIVSGLNLGIEGIAHLSTLAEGGMAIGVLTTPLTETYPEAHKQLQILLGERGLLLSQFSPLTQSERWHTILRNQVMAALSDATLIVEERDGGGAVKQAYYALEQEKRVVLFKHLVDNRSLVWPRRLVQKQGVFSVKSPEAIFPILFPSGVKKSPSKPLPQQFSLFEST